MSDDFADDRKRREHVAGRFLNAFSPLTMISVPQTAGTGAFETHLCDCSQDMGACMLTWLLPCFAISENWASARGEPCDACHCINMIHPIWTRGNIRRARMMPDEYCWDWCSYACCFCCMVAQDSLELKKLKELNEGAGSDLPR
jgi:Cys-rich protein (TIGR01571 family)